ncbi:hypothetical protein FRB94_007775 [Tulasnella sp. JGI-2019a]|nr:hypothetical protein FRB93_007147 [Tulasnella sp. JGI-2019a]KAG8997326.1 hypothetical protein FRB94_007775 [Tulasnella sp. JGI-2019a]
MHSQLTVLFFLSLFGLALTTSDSTSSHLNRHRAIRHHIAERSTGNDGPAVVAPASSIRRRGSGKTQYCAARLSSASAATNATVTAESKEQDQITTTTHTTTTKAAKATTTASSDSGSSSGSSKTYTGGDATFYGIGLGACGEDSKEPELIAAMAHELFDSFAVTAAQKANPNLNPVCGRRVTASLPGRGSVTVRIVDRCGGCEILSSLDFSMAAFDQVSNSGEALGRIHGLSWSFID